MNKHKMLRVLEGSAPKPPGFIAYVLKARLGVRREGKRGGYRSRPALLPTPGSTLELLPSRALSFAQAE
jgi:hypothetical protein